MEDKMYYTFKDTPAGTLLLTNDGKVVTGIHWKTFKRSPQVMSGWIKDKSLFAEVSDQLDEYFAGTRRVFTIAHRTKGTAFQKAVWKILEQIPYGTNSSYGAIAAAIGQPRAVRAVGTAVGSNPLSIVVPCHRVLTAARRLGGYAGGLTSKQYLLRIEHIPFLRRNQNTSLAT